MKKVYPFFLFLLLPFAASFAQESPGRINGSVKDDNGKPLEAATVELLKASDSTVEKIAVSDKLGDFVLDNLKFGKYLLSFSAVGHDKKLSEIINLTASNSSVELSAINLQQVKNSLSAVTVVAKKPMVEIKIDK